jgi:hypothetical protein
MTCCYSQVWHYLEGCFSPVWCCLQGCYSQVSSAVQRLAIHRFGAVYRVAIHRFGALSVSRVAIHRFGAVSRVAIHRFGAVSRVAIHGFHCAKAFLGWICVLYKFTHFHFILYFFRAPAILHFHSERPELSSQSLTHRLHSIHSAKLAPGFDPRASFTQRALLWRRGPLGTLLCCPAAIPQAREKWICLAKCLVVLLCFFAILLRFHRHVKDEFVLLGVCFVLLHCSV